MAESLHEMAKRMCEGNDCRDCGVNVGASRCVVFKLSTEKDSDNQIERLQAWAAANPVKTYKDDFFEKFPGAEKDEHGYPMFTVNCFYRICHEKRYVFSCLRQCAHSWDKPIGYWESK